MTDAWAIIWKEWREMLGQRGLRGKSGLLLTIGVFGIALPLQAGRAWIESPVLLVTWSWVPMFLVSTVIADAFAGERERHTLETLLATRLSDRTILFGKMGAAIGYAAAITVASLVLGVLTVNVAVADRGIVDIFAVHPHRHARCRRVRRRVRRGRPARSSRFGRQRFARANFRRWAAPSCCCSSAQ